MRSTARLIILFVVVAAAVAGVLSVRAAHARAAPAPAREGAYRNFKAAIYIAVGTTRQLANPQTLASQYARIASQLRFDKVYLEVYRNGVFADERSLAAIRKFFNDRGVTVSGGVTLAAGGHGGQFGTFDFEQASDRAECQRAVELAARNFDEVILDDFFFYTTKSDADIAAKGQRSWTQYRLEKMRSVAQELVLKPARAMNPHVRMIIKYPNWYEHFQGLGYDLDVEAKAFDAIYTGTETRDPEITDQLLQQYESYLVFRYYDNIRPNGANRGGWVDTYSVRYVDRYAEQLWDTLFAKAPEITLFNWTPMASQDAVPPGERDAWREQPTSFNWDEMVRSFKPGSATKSAKGETAGVPGWGRAAGYALEQVDAVLGKLGRPVGVASYKPYQSSGEDFLHNYLGNVGIPIELSPNFPTEADLVLLTEAAKHDPDIVAKIKSQLVAGRNVVVTSGLLGALQGKGIEDIAEVELTGRRVPIHEFFNGYGAGNGTRLDDSAHPGADITFPEIRFYTNDSWTLVRGVANARGFPILLMNRYSRGIFYVLNIPENIGDLYSLPQAVTRVIKGYLQADLPVRLDAPPGVSLFVYDNGTFVVQSFRKEEVGVTVSVAAADMWGRRGKGLSEGAAQTQGQVSAPKPGDVRGPAPPQGSARESAQEGHGGGPPLPWKLRNLVTGEIVVGEIDAAGAAGPRGGAGGAGASSGARDSAGGAAALRGSYNVRIPAHSYAVFAVQ